MKIAVAAKQYLRIVGYYSEKNNANKGKAQEIADRKCYN